MKIGIHKGKGFPERWISYCKKNAIEIKLVNCYNSDIVQVLEDCDALMWHFHHAQPNDVLMAKQLLNSIEKSGKPVFPDSNSFWHFDDKVAQKFLLESVDAPLIPTFVFFDEGSALKWANSTTFPKVQKLRGGAGAVNVRKVENLKEAKKIIYRSFGKGFSQFNRSVHFKESFRKFKEKQINTKTFVRSFGRLFISPTLAKNIGREKGYIYFQDFVPNNDSDIRIIVINGKAFGIQRLTRPGDFRASGSGRFRYLDTSNSHIDCVKLAFQTSLKLNASCLAYDFVYDEAKNPLIVEISYGFSTKAYDNCPGYWNRNLDWNHGSFSPQSWMVEWTINQIKK